VLRETTSRGLCGLVCPSRTSERGGEGDCVKEGGEEEGKCERERALERLRYYIPGKQGRSLRGWTVDNFQLSETVLRGRTGRGGEPEGRTAQAACEPTAGVSVRGCLCVCARTTSAGLACLYRAHPHLLFLPGRAAPPRWASRPGEPFAGLPNLPIYLSTYVSIYMFLVLAVPEVPVLESAICVCVCVYYAVPMKKLFAWGDWCVCVCL
jgi:hypothetical protein